MRIAPGYTSPPPPPSDQQLQGQVTSAQTKVNQVQSTLHAVQGSLTQALSQEDVRVQQVDHLVSDVNALQAQLKADQAALTQRQSALNQVLAAELGSRTGQAIKSYRGAVSHAPGAPNAQTATSNLQSATFNEEVWVYEQTHGGQGAVPGSTPWQHDAQSLLGDAGALQTARDMVASQHLRRWSGKGLDLQHFGAEEWAGEAVAQAQLQDPQSADGSLGKTPTLTQREQGEQGAARSLSSSLAGLSMPSSGIDPRLGRQALLANSYVSTLAHEIARTIQDVAGNQNQTQADGIGFLYHTVGSPSFDPALATVIIEAAAPMMQQYLKDQSGASTDQASQAYVYAAGLYDVLLNAQQGGVPGAERLAGQLAQWSYAAADATDASASYNGRGTSKLDSLLTEVQSKTQAQHVPANLLHAWEGLSQKVVDTGYGTDNVHAWARFQTSLDGNAQLKARPPSASALAPAVPGLSPDQVHNRYDTALGLLSGQQQNGNLPARVSPVALAAVQTQMMSGYGTGDQVALARAMIAGQQQQLNTVWLQQNSGEQLLMPVDDLTGQASAEVLGLGGQIGLGGESWSDAVSQGEPGMEAALPTAPSSTVIDATTQAYEKLSQAQASGHPSAIAKAQQGVNEALMKELQSVYGTQFSGNALISDDENAGWRYLAEVQVMRDHASSTAMVGQVSDGLQASEIIELSLGGGRDAQHSVIALDEQLAPLQAPGADPGGAIAQAVLSDARVRSLIGGQVSEATTGTAANATAALTQAAQVLAPYEQSDPNGLVAQQIITGTVGSGLTRQILANARGAAARSHDALGTAAPLMQAAQLSPSLTLAVYQAFNLPGPSAGQRPSSSQGPSNALILAAGAIDSAADCRNVGIVYATLPDNVQMVGVPAQLAQAQAAKAGLISAVGTQLSRPQSAAAQNIKSWIQASFKGVNSAPAWLANDLISGYQYSQGGQVRTVGKLRNADLISALQGALYQPTGGGGSSSAAAGSTVDMAAAAGVDGTTLQQFSSEEALASYVAQAYGLRPTSGAGASATYDPNTVVDGNITLGQIITGLKRQAGVTSVDADHPLVLQAAPVTIGEQQGAEFRVQRRDGSTVWLGADGSVTQGWAGQDTALTQNLSTTAVQVVGGVTEADASGNANPVLKIDTPTTPLAQRPWWESYAKDALAITAGVVATALTEGNVFVGFAAAFAVQQLFDAATNDGEMTVFQYAADAIHGRVGLEDTEQFAVDTGTEAISAAADAVAPGAASWVAGKIAGTATEQVAAAAGEAATTATTTAAASSAGTGITATTTTAATATAGTGTAAAATATTATTAGTETATTAATTTTTSGTDMATTASADTPTTVGTAASRQAGEATVWRRLGAATAASGAQAIIQSGGSLAKSAITLGANDQLTWGAFGHAAGQQGLNLILTIPAGGVAGGLLPGNIVVQTAAGFGTSVGQTEIDDQVSDHHNLTLDDLIGSLIMTVPTTAQHYADRPGGLAMIKRTFGSSADYHPQPLPTSADREPVRMTAGSGDPRPTVNSLPDSTDDLSVPATAEPQSLDPDTGKTAVPAIIAGGSRAHQPQAAASAASSIFHPARSDAAFADHIDAMPSADLQQHTSEADFVTAFYQHLFLQPGETQSPDESRFQSTANSMRSAFVDDQPSKLDAMVRQAEYLLESLSERTRGAPAAAAASSVPDPSGTVPAAAPVLPTEVSTTALEPNATAPAALLTAEVSAAAPAESEGAAGSSLRIPQLTRTVATAAVDRIRDAARFPSFWAKAVTTAGAGIAAWVDPLLAHVVLTQGEDTLRYVGEQLLNDDGVVWISRSMALALKTLTEVYDGDFGPERITRLLDGTATKRDLRILELTAKRYVRSNFDASNPAAVKQARAETLQAINDYTAWISQNRADIMPGYRLGIEQAHVTANLHSALANLHGIDSYNPHEIAAHLFDRWQNRLRNRMFYNAFGTFTRAENIRNNILEFVDPSQRVDLTRAWQGMLARRTGFGARLGYVGVGLDNTLYMPALAGEGFVACAKTFADLDLLVSRYLHLGAALQPLREAIGNIRESSTFKKLQFLNKIIASFFYGPACLGWMLKDAFYLHAFIAKWLGDGLVTGYCFVETHSLLPKAGETPESGFPSGPFRWQNWKVFDKEVFQWTTINAQQWRLFNKWSPASDLAQENGFFFGIILSDSFRPDVQQAAMTIAKSVQLVLIAVKAALQAAMHIVRKGLH